MEGRGAARRTGAFGANFLFDLPLRHQLSFLSSKRLRTYILITELPSVAIEGAKPMNCALNEVRCGCLGVRHEGTLGRRRVNLSRDTENGPYLFLS